MCSSLATATSIMSDMQTRSHCVTVSGTRTWSSYCFEFGS
ncbi:hypothetical protein OESDEN_24561 [Oesophagostomum dentatum]|uniref:Uncharacterized protein n=1 Tax=Oesophagostomum dentatum TaxID=61180 RepID=A0A0B1RX77_OESDE|nr:hypothetical protein OESDEN_24561 [Oesophagostomum dentatum]